MLSTVLTTIERHRLFGPGERVLVAVSGGADSMALLAALWEAGPRLGLAIEVAVVDHGLRAGAAAEQALVSERAAALGLPFHLLRVDVASARDLPPAGEGRGEGTRRTRRGRGVQEVARRLRLDALAELAARRGLARVALGHQADDQAETVLFRILRGTGLAGLGGIPYRRGPFVRPLLDVTRAEILRYLRRRSVPWMEDPSNEDRRFARVRIRCDILPLLRRENPRIDRALRSLAAAARARGRAGGDAGGPAEGHAGEEDGAALAPEAGRALVARAGGRAAGVAAATAVRIAEAAHGARGTKSFDVAGGRVTIAYGRVAFEARPAERTKAPRAASAAGAASAVDIEISGAGDYPFGAGHLLRVSRAEGPAPPAPAAARDEAPWSWYDADRVRWPLVARLRRPGDRMRPRGGGGSRKLSDLLIDAKIPRQARGALPVVVAGDGELLYVPGLRPSDAAAPTPSTRRLLGLTTTSIRV
jgi:tRNA(Ile)-lysidine synthase